MRLKENKGITLIALVVTIIVLIILATVSINLLLGQNGILRLAKKSVEDTNKAQAIEKLEFALIEYKIQNNLNDINQKEVLENILNNIEGISEVNYNENEFKIIIGNYEFLVGLDGNYEYIGLATSPNINIITEYQNNKAVMTIVATPREEAITEVILEKDNNVINIQDLIKVENGIYKIEYIATEEGKYIVKAKTNNVTNESTKEIIIDLTPPTAPVINSNFGYPVLTEYGVKSGSAISISCDDNADIYYSIDNETTWIKYEGEFDGSKLSSIVVKSVKRINKLETKITKEITIPSDAIGPEAYDGDENTGTIRRRCIKIYDSFKRNDRKNNRNKNRVYK